MYMQIATFCGYLGQSYCIRHNTLAIQQKN